MASKITSIGFRLRKHRNLMGYSIRYAAGKIGIAPIRLSQWERNMRKPSIDNIVKLAVLYRVLVDELVFDLRQDVVRTLDYDFRKAGNEVEKKIKGKASLIYDWFFRSVLERVFLF